MKSPVIKRSIVIAGHKTSVSLEDAFWKGLKEIADDRNLTLSDLVSTIDTDRRHGNLSSAIRLFVLDHYRNQAVSHRGACGDARHSSELRRSRRQFCAPSRPGGRGPPRGGAAPSARGAVSRFSVAAV